MAEIVVLWWHIHREISTVNDGFGHRELDAAMAMWKLMYNPNPGGALVLIWLAWKFSHFEKIGAEKW